MSFELFNSLATLGTFLVIAATAIAALVQLRHARSGNLIEGLDSVDATFTSEAWVEAQRFMIVSLPKLATDPAFRYAVAHREARTAEMQAHISKYVLIGNALEKLGVFVKNRLLDKEITLEQYSSVVLHSWGCLEGLIATVRHTRGDALWENFEYLAMLSQDWMEKHPHGTYPHGARRLVLNDIYREEDERYAASLAPA